MLAKTTVSQSQMATVKVNQAGSSPPPSGALPKAWLIQPIVVITAPTSTTNITGLWIWWRGLSFLTLAQSAGRKSSRSNMDERRRSLSVTTGTPYRERC